MFYVALIGETKFCAYRGFLKVIGANVPAYDAFQLCSQSSSILSI